MLLEKQPECIPVQCLYNDKLGKGVCIGVSKHTRSYEKDVIRMCWVKNRPTINLKCVTDMQVQMTPKEAELFGVALIQAAIVGKDLLRNIEKLNQKIKEVNKFEKETNQKIR